MLTIPSAHTPAASDLRQRLEVAYQDHALQSYSAGQVIPLQDQEIFVVSRGVVILNTIYPTGEEGLLGFAGPGTPFGYPLSRVDPYQALALSAVDLMALPMAEIERSPALGQDLFRGLNRRLQQSEMMLALMGQRRVEDRLRQFLLLLKEDFSQPVAEGHRLTIRLTHQHLANALGSTRVTITRTIGQLRQEGWLQVDPSRHLILKD
ncbi:MAG: Crp/Fnr family transcriptional regulator [Prochlorotrichaceae cyanobacterium]